jgi:hypothetical protein
MNITHPREKPIFFLSLLLASVFWASLAWLGLFLLNKIWPDVSPQTVALSSSGLLLLAALIHNLRSVMKVATLRGYSVELSGQQFPDLYNRLHAVCKRLEIDPMPAAYISRDRHGADAFSLRYLGRGYLALNANLVNALTERQGAIDFVMGYELSRLYHHYRNWEAYLWPVRVLPLIGPAYARTQVYVRDRHGFAACKTKADAAFALAMVAAGDRRWKSLSIPDFAAQAAHHRVFSMSYAELISARPWLSKRMANLRALSTSSEHLVAQRNALAYVAALFTPYVGWRHPGLWLRLLLLLVWPLAISHALWAGERLLLEKGLIKSQSFLSGRIIDFARDTKPEAQPAKAAPPPVVKLKPDTSNPYRRLEDDLRLLGRYARQRQMRQGGIPCEIGNIRALSLNYPADRYAFSCDEPKVYTIVERGEFEPGKESHIHTYNWEQRKIILGPSEPEKPEK